MKKAPAVVPEAGWKEVDLPFGIASGRTLASGLANDRLRLKLFLRDSDKHLVGKIWFGEGAEGPPMHAHGGASSYILDEAMGSAAWANGLPVVARELKFELFNMVPLYQDHTIEAWVENAIDRSVLVKCKLVLQDGRTAVKGTGQFHILMRSQLAALFSQLPPDRAQAEQRHLSGAYKWAPEDDDAN